MGTLATLEVLSICSVLCGAGTVCALPDSGAGGEFSELDGPSWNPAASLDGISLESLGRASSGISTDKTSLSLLGSGLSPPPNRGR